MSRDTVSWPGKAHLASFNRLVAASREVVAGRLASRAEGSVEALAEAARAHPEAAGVVLLEILGRSLGVAAGKLALRDSLERLFDVGPDDLGPALAREWRGLDPPKGLDPLSVGLLRELARVAPVPSWAPIAAAVDPTPASDREWIEVMLGLRVDEWVRTWAPVVRVQGSSVTPSVARGRSTA